MNQRQVQVQFSKKYRRSRMAEGQTANSNRRSTLFTVEDSKQLAVESTRARLIQQLSNPDKALPRDFTAYFHSSTTKSDPAYVVTSHHTHEPLPRRRLVIPTYPCIQSLRWNPYVETSIDEEPDVPVISPGQRSDQRSDRLSDYRPNPRAESSSDPRVEEPGFNCRCESCSRKRCPSRSPSVSAVRPAFRDNIMTFCDQHTMTPRLHEVGCGCTPGPSTRVSDVSVTASDITVKDTQACVRIHQLYSPEKSPASILKRNGQTIIQEECPSYLQSHCHEHEFRPRIDYCQEPERDFAEEYIEPSKISSIKSFFKCKKKKECTNPRRNIYNEGISDVVAKRYSMTPIKVPSPINLKKECSKVSVRSRCCLNEGIPYSHRTYSRYHNNCKKSNHSRSFFGDSDEIRHNMVASPEIAKKSYANRPVRFNKLQSIRMPKRVLTSERDIESYIDRGFPQITVPVTRRPRGHSGQCCL